MGESRIYIVHCDGLCEPVNPGGIATYGWTVGRGGREIQTGCGLAAEGPNATNNVAEYTAVLQALAWLVPRLHPGDAVRLYTDSQLVVLQIQGVYRVRSRRLQPLYRQVQLWLTRARDRGASVTVAWVPREENQRADELSRIAWATIMARRRPELASRYTVRYDAGNQYFLVQGVQKDSHPGFRVRFSPLQCTCKHFRRSGRPCNHIQAVIRHQLDADPSLSEADVCRNLSKGMSLRP